MRPLPRLLLTTALTAALALPAPVSAQEIRTVRLERAEGSPLLGGLLLALLMVGLAGIGSDIHYDPPGAELLPQVWRVMSENFDADLSEALIGELVALFPRITPRDVKMLLRLTLRMARARGEPLTADLFRRNAMFRGINAKVCEK